MGKGTKLEALLRFENFNNAFSISKNSTKNHTFHHFLIGFQQKDHLGTLYCLETIDKVHISNFLQMQLQIPPYQ